MDRTPRPMAVAVLDVCISNCKNVCMKIRADKKGIFDFLATT